MPAVPPRRHFTVSGPAVEEGCARRRRRNATSRDHTTRGPSQAGSGNQRTSAAAGREQAFDLPTRSAGHLAAGIGVSSGAAGHRLAGDVHPSSDFASTLPAPRGLFSPLRPSEIARSSGMTPSLVRVAAWCRDGARCSQAEMCCHAVHLRRTTGPFPVARPVPRRGSDGHRNSRQRDLDVRRHDCPVRTTASNGPAWHRDGEAS